MQIPTFPRIPTEMPAEAVFMRGRVQALLHGRLRVYPEA